MSKNLYSYSPEFFKSLPKIELHRHLEGSLRIRTMMDIVRAHGLDVKDTGYLRPLVQMEHNEPYNFENFLAKFGTLRLFYRSPDIIRRVTWEAIEDAAVDNVRYMELRFTPIALSRAEGFPLTQVIDWVTESAREAQEALGICVRLITSVNRHEGVKEAEKVFRLAADRQSAGIVGVDLAGNEADFSAQPFEAVFREAREAGLRISIHAGEWGGAENVREAIKVLGAERIGHGIRILEDPNVVRLARNRGTAFEVCVTSNYHSGVVPILEEHPLLEMMLEGLNVTINTDDPSISQITLSDEYRVVAEELGVSLGILRERVLAAARAAFLPEKERNRMMQQFSDEFTERMLQLD